MSKRAVASFDVTGWDPTPYEVEEAGPHRSRVKVRKTFTGDLVGESTADLMTCVADPANLAGGAGYIAAERVAGTLAGRAGTFVMHHWGISGGAGTQSTAGHVVPGSGTGELAGLTGTVEISVDPTTGHRLFIDYELA
jgi:Protein of unknown function (DUF3224)